MAQLPDPEGAALGVDGGAGHLKFAVRHAGGRVLHVQTPGANPILIGMEEFVVRLDQGIRESLAKAGLKTRDIRSAGLGLSGVDREEQVRFLREKLRSKTLPECDRIWIGNDALAALRQGAGKLQGLILIAGTGSICLGVDRKRRVFRAGGWGGELGDEGSAFWIGRQALQYACRMADGRIPAGSLLNLVLQELDLAEAMDLIPWTARLTREKFKQQTAQLFPAIARNAMEGDRTCGKILESARTHLLQHVDAVIAHMDIDERPSIDRLVCAGGVFSGSEEFYSAFQNQVNQTWPAIESIRFLDSASLGALALGEEASAESYT